jgi:hypothetical protein
MNSQLLIVLAALASASAFRVSVPAARGVAALASRTAAVGRAGIILAESKDEAEPEVPKAAEAITPPAGWMAVEEDIWTDDKQATERVEGGQTLKTFKMPDHAERVQYILTSPNGRPVKGKVELWIGPIRCVHELIYDCMNGGHYPLKATLQFKKLSPVLKISTDSTYEFPLQYGVFVPEPDESKVIGEVCSDMFYSAPMKERVQGGSTIDNKGGAIRTFHIDPSWEKTQIMVWSKDVGKKSFKTNIEVLQGPNNAKQHLNLRCGGSTQPYHAVIETPGPGWTVRCNSKKYIEDGLFEIAVAPYGETVDVGDAVAMGGGPVMLGGNW